VTRAVITGVGAVSPFGLGSDRLWDALEAGASAIGPITVFDPATFPTRVAGQVPDDAVDHGPLRDRKLAFAVAAAREAWRMAGCGDAEREARMSIALGLEQASLEDFAPIFEDGHIQWQRQPDVGPSGTRYRAPVDVAARAVAETLELRGPTVVHTSACAAGALAVSHAASLIERGAASIVVCGASDSMINRLGVGGMARLGAPSPRAEPDACRPFDRRRDGLAIGEGAAMFVIESSERAAARGATALATVLGWGSTQDAYKVTAPRPDGSAAAEAMRRAMARAALAPGDIGYINAHGTGTPLNDPTEVKAIRAALGDAAERIPVSSIKGAVGHLMAAAGALELAASMMAFDRDVLPPTAHLRELDPECEVDVIGPEARAARVDAILSNSFGFGGQNATVILGRHT
jgi:3-oxoacyl-(acyl-carrier-protein) synthase